MNMCTTANASDNSQTWMFDRAVPKTSIAWLVSVLLHRCILTVLRSLNFSHIKQDEATPCKITYYMCNNSIALLIRS